MNRFEEINEFLKFVANYFNKQKTPCDEDIVYGFLSNYGLTNEDVQNKDISYLFNEYIEHFKNNDNIDVYHDERQRNFLQFNTGYEGTSRYVKLYISLNKSAMQQGVKIIFEYLAANHMKHASKVANKLRSDAIVLRMESIQDAEKVMKFINSAPYLATNAKLTNPFLARNGKVGVAYDDRLSYNALVAHVVTDYINSKKGLIKKYSYEDFMNFIMAQYNKIFVDHTELPNFVNTPYFQENYQRINQCGNSGDLYKFVVNNFREVYEVLLYNVRSNNFREIYGIINTNSPVDKKELLDGFIKYAYQKYNSIDTVINALTLYLNGKTNSITKDNGYRDMFVSNLTPNDLVNIIQHDVRDYIEDVLGLKDTVDLDFTMFIQGCKDTFNKYGYNQLRLAINEFVKGNFGPMTNDNNCRTYFKSRYRPEELANLAQNYINKIMNGKTQSLNTPIGDQVIEYLLNVTEEPQGRGMAL